MGLWLKSCRSVSRAGGERRLPRVVRPQQVLGPLGIQLGGDVREHAGIAADTGELATPGEGDAQSELDSLYGHCTDEWIV